MLLRLGRLLLQFHLQTTSDLLVLLLLLLRLLLLLVLSYTFMCLREVHRTPWRHSTSLQFTSPSLQSDTVRLDGTNQTSVTAGACRRASTCFAARTHSHVR